MGVPGDKTLALIGQLMAEGIAHVVLLMRHSARTFGQEAHDLLNPLTDEGRALSTRFGERLPKELVVRGYASPAARCVETAQLILDGHRESGGKATRSRPAEALGVFYVLDQMKMFRALQAAGGQRELLHQWYAGELAEDIMIPPAVTANLIARFALRKLAEPVGSPQLDLLVSHDMTLYTLRDRLLRQPAAGYGEIDFLDGIAFFREAGAEHLQADDGTRAQLELAPLA